MEKSKAVFPCVRLNDIMITDNMDMTYEGQLPLEIKISCGVICFEWKKPVV